MEYSIRLAREEDAQAIHDIYGYYAEHTEATFTAQNPSVEDYREKIAHTLRMYPFYVAQAQGRVIGFAYGAQIRPHDAYVWDVEATLYLAPDAPRRIGIGTALYQRLLETLTKQGFKTVYGVVTDTNLPSLALHERLGFTKAGHFHNMGYKHGAWLGVVWMQKNIGSFEGTPQPPTALPALLS
ncbi:MAG: GNAT family N-acetyltransferase [Eubacteriales bacterium]|nr:GNAT family N-acetyltransferase [Eubacteriales bacterium]